MPEDQPLLDANVLVRYLIRDDPTMLARAKALIESDQTLGITVVAVLEGAHVLEKIYGYDRVSVVDGLVGLIVRANLVGVGIDKDQMAARLMLCRESRSVSYGDALLAATAATYGNVPVYTFDRRLHRSGVTALPL